MSVTLRQARDAVLTKLGDTTVTPSSARVWTESEIEGAFRDAVRDFAFQTRIVWDMDYLDDLPYTGGYNFAFEKPFAVVGKILHRQYDYENEFERDYISSQLPPANHTNVDERDDFLITALVAAVSQAPDAFLFAERLTYDNRRIIPLNSKVLESFDSYYEIVRGTVYGYLQDKDGLRTIRKYKPPVSVASYYWSIGTFGAFKGSVDVVSAQPVPASMHIDEWGIQAFGIFDAPLSLGWDFLPPGALADIPVVPNAITALPEFSGDTIVGQRGILRRLPGYFPANGPWGTIRKISQSGRNTRIEFIRRAKVPAAATDTFDLPDYMVKYLRHYVMAWALRKKGIGQDPALAAHFDQRYEQCIERTKARMKAIYSAKLVRMGGSGSGETYGPRPYARLPRNLPES